VTRSPEPRYLEEVAPRAGEDGVWLGEVTSLPPATLEKLDASIKCN
jgi:hypothetical protein